MVLALTQQMFKLVILITTIVTGNLQTKKEPKLNYGITFLKPNAIVRENFIHIP